MAHSGRAVVSRGVSYLRDLWPAHLTICNRAVAEEYALGPLCPLCIRRFRGGAGLLNFCLLTCRPTSRRALSLRQLHLKPILASSRTAVSRGGSHLRDLWAVYLSASAKMRASPCVDYASSISWPHRVRRFPLRPISATHAMGSSSSGADYALAQLGPTVHCGSCGASC